VPTIGDLTSSSVDAGRAGAATALSLGAAVTPAGGVIRASIIGITAGIGTGVAIETPPRVTGLFAIRIFTPFSDEISIESTEDSSIISINFFT
jgi:hypothetical protein